MGKTSKKAAPGGDERNIYDRRLKSTNATPKISETILPERQRESDGLNRPKLTGTQKTIPTGQGKYFKSKLRSPTKFGINNPTKRLSKVSGTSSFEKKPIEIVKDTAVSVSTMQPETQEADANVNMPIQKENSKIEVDDKKVVVETENEEQTSGTEKQNVDHAVSDETFTVDKEVEMEHAEVSENGEKVEPEPTENLTEPPPKESSSQESNNNEAREELSESDIKLSLDVDEESSKPQNHEQPNDTETNDEAPKNKEVDQEVEQNITIDEEKVSEESEAASNDTKSIANEKEEQQSESQTDTESSLTDTVEKGGTSLNNDSSFVSYDASIMLKDVQIKLNDCLKDNSKLFDVSSAATNPSKDLSFGRTLRNISGRNSINRMRHVTVRENRLSPNSSLYVNTSAMSLTQDETGDHKISQHGSAGLAETRSTNGSPVERKRKLGSDDWSSTKKPKTEYDNSLLNTSIGYLKSLRRPVQSTPNKVGYKFQAEKLNISSISSSGDDEKMLDQNEGMRKWCVIM